MAYELLHCANHLYSIHRDIIKYTLMNISQIFKVSIAAVISVSCAISSVHAESVIIPKPPVLNATAYVLMDAASGEILVQKKCRQAIATGQYDQNDDQLFGDSRIGIR
jgi:hypothetical protein